MRTHLSKPKRTDSAPFSHPSRRAAGNRLVQTGFLGGFRPETGTSEPRHSTSEAHGRTAMEGHPRMTSFERGRIQRTLERWSFGWLLTCCASFREGIKHPWDIPEYSKVFWSKIHVPAIECQFRGMCPSLALTKFNSDLLVRTGDAMSIAPGIPRPSSCLAWFMVVVCCSLNSAKQCLLRGWKPERRCSCSSNGFRTDSGCDPTPVPHRLVSPSRMPLTGSLQHCGFSLPWTPRIQTSKPLIQEQHHGARSGAIGFATSSGALSWHRDSHRSRSDAYYKALSCTRFPSNCPLTSLPPKRGSQ